MIFQCLLEMLERSGSAISGGSTVHQDQLICVVIIGPSLKDLDLPNEPFFDFRHWSLGNVSDSGERSASYGHTP
jgi:hypothetical protein